jgi:acetylglutamate synthase
MLSFNSSWQSSPVHYNIKVELVDEMGNHIDPRQVKEVEYLSKFQNKCVVNKVYLQMIADQRSGVIEVYHDKIVVKDN